MGGSVSEVRGRTSRRHHNKGNIARKTFDAIAAARNVTTVRELDKVFGNMLADLGFNVFVGVNAVNSSGRPNVEILFGHTHAQWEEHYQRHRYFAHDAIIQEMLSSTEPLFWSDLKERHNVTADERKVLNEAGEFGLKNGFMTPIHNLDRSISAVLLMGDHVDARDPDVRTAAHMLSVYYGSMGRRIHRTLEEELETTRVALELSMRQLECLKWVREGKSSQDIADILGLSSRTVDFYIGAACARTWRTNTRAGCRQRRSIRRPEIVNTVRLQYRDRWECKLNFSPHLLREIER